MWFSDTGFFCLQVPQVELSKWIAIKVCDIKPSSLVLNAAIANAHATLPVTSR